MGKAFFDTITRLSIRLKWVTILVTVVLLILGVYAASTLSVELLPPIDIPSTFVLAQGKGAMSGNVMLHAYTIPLEEAALEHEDIVNVETTTTSGLMFAQLYNEFGLDQQRIQDDLRAILHDLDLPQRVIDPPEGTSPAEMIGDLTPDVVLYLIAYSQQNNIGFLPQLSGEVWESFSPEVLGALPEDAFSTLPTALSEALKAKATGDDRPLPNPETEPAPELPANWQMDRFVTADDLIELTGNRSLADIFNGFITEGQIRGPLGTVDDLTAEDVQAIIAIEESCRASAAAAPNADEDSSCSLLGYLDGATVAALLTHFDSSLDGTLSEAVSLPSDYLDMLTSEDRNVVAAAFTAQYLTGTRTPRPTPLPLEWQFDPPQVIAFSIDDLPLAAVSIDASDADITQEELRTLVENEIIPQLEALDAIATINVQGGEQIRADLLNRALEAEGLEPVSNGAANPNAANEATSTDPTDEPAGNAPADEAAPADVPEGPALPAMWTAMAAAIPGVEELDTADDLLRIAGVPPSQVLNMAGENPLGARALEALTADVLLFLADYEDDFFGNLSPVVLQSLSDDTLAALPEDVQAQANAAVTPELGAFWQRLADAPELAETPLNNAADLEAFGDGPAATLNSLALEIPDDLRFFTVRLLDDLSPEVFSYLIEADEGFLDALEPATLCALSPAVLSLDPVQERIAEIEDAPCDLAGIAAGETPSAAQSLNHLDEETESERVVDESAPPLPGPWAGIAGFVGAAELNTADDLFYAAGPNGYLPPSALLNNFASPEGGAYLGMLSADVLLYVADCDQGELCEQGFFNNLADATYTYLSDEAAAGLPPEVQERREAALLGSYIPQAAVTRTNGNNSLLLEVYKTREANTVSAWDEVREVLDDLEQTHPGINFVVAFEQASFIEESISGVAREGGLGAVMAVVVILIFLNFSVRSTLVTAVSLPTSVAMAFVIMKWVPGAVNDALFPLSQDATGFTKDALTFLLRLFPESVSLNIMTLSGLTVAIGRVVDDAIVVLETIYRNIQKGEDQLQAVLQGTREVSVAIFAATVTTVVVFLPIGLFGGIIGEFFLPFGLAVTYALLSSFVVAITIVPLFAYLFIRKSSLPSVHRSRLEDGYRAILTWALDHRWAVMAIATVAFLVGVFILGQLPSAFLPAIGEPTISVTVDLPPRIGDTQTTIAITDAKVRRFEQELAELEGITTVQTTVGGGGNELFGGSGTISETAASLSLSIVSQDELERLTPLVREKAERIFNDLDRDGTLDEGDSNVTVSGAPLSAQGFGGFSLVISGDPKNPPTLADLEEYDAEVVETLSSIDGVINVESSLALVSGADTSQTFIRVNGVPAVRYTAELETDDTLGLTTHAVEQVRALDLPSNFDVSQGYVSELQTEGFSQMFVSMGIAVVIVYLVMVLTFGSLIHPVTILFSLPLAVVGAAIGLQLTGRVLGLSAVVGLLMLVGIVVTNAIVLIDRVQANRKAHNMGAREALIEGGSTRLRPILMTALATMIALLPLAIGLSEGAIIAAELGTVVIGGLFSSTLLTLFVVPVVYSLFSTAQDAIERRLRRS